LFSLYTSEPPDRICTLGTKPLTDIVIQMTIGILRDAENRDREADETSEQSYGCITTAPATISNFLKNPL
jgi:hypothetical protein